MEHNINKDQNRAVYFSKSLKRVETYLTLKGRAITFVNDVKYLRITFDRRMTCRTHIDLIVTKALRTFLKIYSLLKSEKLSIRTKMTLHKALISSKLTYAWPTWESAADKQLLKLRRLQTKYSVYLVAYRGARRPVTCIGRSKFRMSTIS
jgi:hypothetical protein